MLLVPRGWKSLPTSVSTAMSSHHTVTSLTVSDHVWSSPLQSQCLVSKARYTQPVFMAHEYGCLKLHQCPWLTPMNMARACHLCHLRYRCNKITSVMMSF